MAVRFDVGSIAKSPYETEDGTLLAEAVFARDGVLEYKTPDGRVRREFRPPEENQKAIAEFGLCPVTAEHPPQLLTEDNADRYRKGMSLQNVRYGKGGFVMGEIAVFDSVAKEQVLSGEMSEVSAGYRCDVDETPGVWIGPDGTSQAYDAVQKNIRVNHIALTRRGRAGPDVRVRTDAIDDPDIAYQVRSDSTPSTPTKRMATIRIDGAEYQIDSEVVASVMASKLRTLEDLQSRADALQEELEESRSNLTRCEARADAAEYVLGNAEEVLEQTGYRRDSEGEYYRTDKKPMPMEEDMSEEDMPEDMPPKKSKKKDGWGWDKKKKMDECGTKKKMDAAEESDEDEDESEESPRNDSKALLAALKEADRLVPRNDDGKDFSDIHFDSIESVTDVHKLVIGALKPDFKLEGRTPDQIEVAYELIKEQAGSRTDSEEVRTDAASYVGDMDAAIGLARKGKKGSLDEAYANVSSSVSNAWQEPLSLHL